MDFLLTQPASIWVELQQFLDQGGTVLLLILPATFVLWFLIIERQYYFWRQQPGWHRQVIAHWQKRSDKSSWFAHKIRQRFLSLSQIQSEKNLATIKAIVSIAPLLGLLGTVTGMIDVFDVMAFTGASNSRAMAAGVSKATIPTMAGMVVSLSGLLFSVQLQRKSQQGLESLANQLLLSDKEQRHENT